MLLPAFITRMIGHADKVETALAANGTALAEAIAKAAGFETQVKTLQFDVGARDATIKDLQAKGELAATDITAKAAEIITLTAAVATEKGRAIAVLAAQGIKLEDLPPGDANATGEKKASAHEQWEAITDPRAKGAFYMANADAILKSAPKPKSA